MLYAILCYNSEAAIGAWSKAEEAAVMGRLAVVNSELTAERKLTMHGRLMPTTTAATVRAGRETVIIDGPFAETKEQLLGLYVVDCKTFEDALDAAGRLARERPSGVLEVRPFLSFHAEPVA
jgi:hypothetical protein